MRRYGITTVGALAGAALLVGGLAGGSAPALAQAQYVIKIGSVTARDPQHQYMEEFKKRAEAASGGRVEVRIFPASQLGDITRMIEGVQLGTIEMVVSATGFYKLLHNAFQVGDAPGIFSDFAHVNRVLSDPTFRQRFLALGESKGVVGLGLWNYGPIVYVASKPLRSIEDFRGKKIRTLATKIESDIAARLGATGVPMPLSEALPALQNGVVDAARGAALVFAGFKYFTVAKYLTEVDDSFIPVATIINRDYYRKMPADLQKSLADVLVEMDAWAKTNVEAADKSAAQIWKEGGGEVIRLSKDQSDEVRRRFAVVADEVLGSQADTREMWTLLKTTAERLK